MSPTADHRSDIELLTGSDTIEYRLDDAGAGLWGGSAAISTLFPA